MALSLTEIRKILMADGLLKEFITPAGWHLNIPAERNFTAVSYDSRNVSPETLFFCKGQGFKEEYLADAVKNGLEVYVAERPYEEISAKLAIIVTDIRKAMALLSMAFYDYPQKKLKLIGFTGTKGKTTSAYFTKKILDQTTAKTALLSTLNTTLDGEHYFKSELTTPESLDLYQMMATAVTNQMTHLIMEVSSQAYKTDRVYGLTFDVGIFLNISPDHIGPIEHPTFEDYFYCKRQLLTHSQQVVIFRQIDYFDLIEETIRLKDIPCWTYGAGGDYQITNGASTLDFSLSSQQDTLNLNGDYRLCLAGDFNKENAAAALIAASLVGADKKAGQAGLPDAFVPGRMNLLITPIGTHVYVDYAHNYLSVKTIGEFAKQNHQGKVIFVTGSTGNKAESRRSDIGKALSETADIVILTSDDPNFEDPQKIAAEIKAGITNPQVAVTFEADRKEAIKQALAFAQPEDAVILAGKGTDAYMTINGSHAPYEGDYQIVQDLSK